ncbi:MAG: tryptophan 2,3-dioxygenase [Anaerolineae bacterium]
MGDPQDELKTARLDFSNTMSYGDYLALDHILNAQHLLSDHHDELLFIIQHQTNELWMKLILHELQAAREAITSDDLSPAFKMMSRVSRIMEQLISAWTVLSTLTPSEYSQFRGYLGHSSGFQSHQYRLIEFVLGHRNAVYMRPFRHVPPIYDQLEAEIRRPSLYDTCLQLLAKRGFELSETVIVRDWSSPRSVEPSVEAAWLTIYQHPDQYWDLYELAEELLDLEDAFRQWQFRHFTTVRRIIGYKQGTGGTSGVNYLRQVMEGELFPELWNVRTKL